MACRRSGDAHSGRRHAWYESLDAVIPIWPAAQMTGEMQGGIPAIGNCEEVAGAFAGPAILAADRYRLQTTSAGGMLPHGTMKHTPGAVCTERRGACARIDHCGDRHARI